MRETEAIKDELAYLGLIAEDCAAASRCVHDAGRTLQLGVPLLISSMEAPESKGLALKTTFGELRDAQQKLHSLIELIEGRLRMIDLEVD